VEVRNLLRSDELVLAGRARYAGVVVARSLARRARRHCTRTRVASDLRRSSAELTLVQTAHVLRAAQAPIPVTTYIATSSAPALSAAIAGLGEG
jgi:hypothetical protein